MGVKVYLTPALRPAAMTIQITKPEVEALINQRLRSGGFKDAEDIVWQALQSSPPEAAAAAPKGAEPAKDMVELFAPLRSLNIVIEADRSKDTGRDINV
jgi:hypothetical protein